MIVRMGANKLRNHLPAFVKAVQEAGQVGKCLRAIVSIGEETINGLRDVH